MKNTVIVITGPTASGKSGIGIELAKKLNGVVVSADSMQIYKKLDVGTAKVTETEADGIKHELIDIIDYDKNFSVSDYKDLCYYKLDEILEQGKTPIIVGGTGLYINAVVNNMEFNKFDEALENEVNVKLEDLTNGKTPDEIYELLYSMDKEAALKIGKGNGKRLIRAIKLNMLGVEKSSIDEKNDLWHKNPSKYNFLTVFLDMPRTLLYDRINKRVDIMLKQGVLEEVKMLYPLRNEKLTAVQAIGYKEFFNYLDGESSLEECTDVLKQKSRNYAKRQITWFKKLEDKLIVDASKSKDEIVKEIIDRYNEESK
ncbi:MAG: tRNA (adenosine(37)-N6)-dimethylallyltransferase MiaA [Clostridia bacterium]|nr:tRNA (adenosine(37)-N6)-dimethylallyltransferase MiaA [Clostridia bacterium]